jgi:hypothetical protein
VLGFRVKEAAEAYHPRVVYKVEVPVLTGHVEYMEWVGKEDVKGEKKKEAKEKEKGLKITVVKEKEESELQKEGETGTGTGTGTGTEGQVESGSNEENEGRKDGGTESKP